MRELFAKAEVKTPYTVVALQKCERMNTLTNKIRRSLKELNLGLKVRFQIITEIGIKDNHESQKMEHSYQFF